MPHVTSYSASSNIAPVVPVTYTAKILSLDTIRYYRLNDTSGTTAVDSSSNLVDGTYNTTYTLGQTGMLAHDATSGSVLFTGGYVDLGTPPNSTTTNCGIALWCQPSGTQGNYAAVAAWNNFIIVTTDVTPTANIGISALGLTTWTGTGIPNDGNPHMIAAIYSGGGSPRASLYLDGSYIGNLSAGTQDMTHHSAISSYWGDYANSVFKGYIGDVAFIQNLTASDVTTLYGLA